MSPRLQYCIFRMKHLHGTMIVGRLGIVFCSKCRKSDYFIFKTFNKEKN